MARPRIMKIFRLLIIPIVGIAAVPSENTLRLNIHPNHTDSDLESPNRMKRNENYWATLTGDQSSFAYDVPDSNLFLLGTIFSTQPRYYYNKFRITRDLNYSSWDELLSNYAYADFKEKIHIELFRNDRMGRIVDLYILPERIKLSKITKRDINIERYYDVDLRFYVPTGPSKVMQSAGQPVRDLPFDSYSQKIFDESIWVGASRINVEINLSLEGFKKDNELILQLIYRISSSVFFTTSGRHLKVDHDGILVLKNS